MTHRSISTVLGSLLVGLLLVVHVPAVHASEICEGQSDNRCVVTATTSSASTIGQGWCDAWNSADVNLFPAAFTDDFVYEDVTGGFVSHGTTDVWEYDKSLFALIPDFHFACTATFVSDGHGSIEWTASGTDVGVYNTGKHFAVRGASVIDVRDGKIARSIDFYDDSTIRRQVGLLPAAG